MENDRLLKLVEAYQEHFKQYNRPDYNETEVRNDFVNPFFEILGWDIQDGLLTEFQAIEIPTHMFLTMVK